MASMQVVLFRHGIAGDREVFDGRGLPDAERRLTGKGERRAREAAGGLLSVLSGIDVIGASPYVRARQTADIVAHVCADTGWMPEKDIVDAMRPGGDPLEICRWLARRATSGTVVLVGHEPDLSDLMAWLTSGQSDGIAHFKKAGACLIELPSRPARGTGELLWLMPPSVLRRLAKD